jgi:MFS family permease
MIALLVGPIRADLAITDFQLSLLTGLGFVLFYTLFGLPLGYLVDRTSRRAIIYWGMTVWSAAAAACSQVHNFTTFLVARMMVGAGEASLIPAANSIIADLFVKRGLTTALSILACGGIAGAALSIVAVGHLFDVLSRYGPVSVPWLGEMAPWRMVFLLLGAPGIVVALLCFTMLEP